ncbi:Long-chain-fatty-acid--AMP ligase FadD29 [Botrimarina hoheduenensis]|uniref:Long-chain-fatty-acid--AMP ligase FadD29 n=1 Tax=Botrimarina hoheduenensis TaxID=2528000 RepID=A0A5C5VZQ5_9BACT|nr:Long-chain-fatty-acid--AMP ligase FadD29 [Botrimarina hoheduenensis]
MGQANLYGLTDDIVDLVGLLRLRATDLGNQRAFTYVVDGDADRVHFTYAQLDARARAIASYLQSQGLAGERALLLFPSGLEYIAAFFGCLYAGVVAVPAYPPRRNANMQRIQAIVGDAQPRVALTTQDVFERIEPVLSELPDLAAIDWKCTRDIPTTDGARWKLPPIDPSDLAFLQYTSGSTGSPKGVMLSHGNLLNNTAIISAAFRPSYASSAVTWLPLYHDMGLIGGVIQPVYFARPITVLTPTHFLQKPLRWLQTISDTGALISGGPNFAYELCVERVTEQEKRRLDLSQWELAFNGAEPVRAETIDRFCAAFASCGFRREAFYPCYGLAEATLLVSGGDKTKPASIRSFNAEALQAGQAQQLDPAAEGAIRLVSSGTSLLEQEILIVDPETKAEKPAGGVGEIWVKGPSVAQGYWRRPEVSSETFDARTDDGRGPFLRTGDLGCMVEGELFINGRLKDLIILRGVNHYPQDLEITVEQSHPDLRPAAGAAFAVGTDGAERLVVIHEVARKNDIDYDAVLTAIRSALGRLHEVSPQAIVLIRPHSIPKTSSGKIQRHACRDAYAAGSLRVVAELKAGSAPVVYARRSKPTPSDSAIEVLSDASGIALAGAPPKPRSRPPVFAQKADPAPEEVIIEQVMQIIRSIAQERADALTLDTDIAGMGLDSLERMEIVAELEREFGGRFTEEAILSMETCRDVVQQVRVNLLSLQDEAGETVAAPVGPAGPEPGDYRFGESLEFKRLAATIKQTDDAGLRNPFFTRHEGITQDTTVIGGKTYINWCSYNYIGMSGDPVVQQAALEAIKRFGTSTSASRVVSGEKTVHRELEQALAELHGVEDAITMVGGHATNETVVGHLLGPGDLILHDSLAHNSILQGCKLSGALRRAFPHNDWRTCGDLLERYRHEHRRVLIAIEGVYSMDGDYCDLARFAELRAKHKCYLMVDEAHSIGTMGATGHGMRELSGVTPDAVDIWMGTISKALGSSGGYIAGSHELIQYLKYTAPGFVFACGLAPVSAAAALAAVQQLNKEPQRVTRLHENASLFLRLAKEAGLNTGTSNGTAIIPIITGNSLLALRLSQDLFDQGINVQPILHPAVEEEAARLRFFITSTHTPDQVERTVKALSEAVRRATGEPGISSSVLVEPESSDLGVVPSDTAVAH